MNLYGLIRVTQLLLHLCSNICMAGCPKSHDYYPRNLQWSSIEQQPDDLVNIDISKCYPSILLNNNRPIPVYTIHDTIEPFNCRNDLNHCGEFYIDETCDQ